MALLLVLSAGGCGGGGDEDRKPLEPGATLTVFSSLPKGGDSSIESAAVADGQRLALEDAQGRAGAYRVRLVQLDSSGPEGGGWDPGVVEANADRAAKDPAAIAYLGELDFGGSAISVPVTNREGLLQVSPSDGITSLTLPAPGAGGAGPERYYPSGTRTFARLVPVDRLQAEALVDWALEGNTANAAIVHDSTPFGRDMASQLAVAATDRSLAVTSVSEVLDAREPESYAGVVKDVSEQRPSVLLYAGQRGVTAGPLLAAVHRALPDTRFFGDSGVATEGSMLRHGGGFGQLFTIKAARPERSYGAEGRQVLARLAAKRGRPVPVEALYGYESMRLVLDAVTEAGARGGDRAAVVGEALAPRTRLSALGAYEILPGGDVSERRFGSYRRRGREIVPIGLRTPPG